MKKVLVCRALAAGSLRTPSAGLTWRLPLRLLYGGSTLWTGSLASFGLFVFMALVYGLGLLYGLRVRGCACIQAAPGGCWLLLQALCSLLCGHLSTTWALVRLAQFSSCMRSCLLPGSSSWWLGSLWSAAPFSVGIGLPHGLWFRLHCMLALVMDGVVP
jgi:hypothetical protein